MTRGSGVVPGLLLALLCVTSACGKYGPPQRTSAGAAPPPVAAGPASAEAECEDEEKRP